MKRASSALAPSPASRRSSADRSLRQDGTKPPPQSTSILTRRTVPRLARSLGQSRLFGPLVGDALDRDDPLVVRRIEDRHALGRTTGDANASTGTRII